MATNNLATNTAVAAAPNEKDKVCNMVMLFAFQKVGDSRNGGVYLNLNLGNYCFTGKDKMYFCAQVKTFPNSQDHLVARSYSDLIKRYKMNGSTTRKWRRNFNKGQVLQDCIGGPPLKSDKIMIAKIIERFQSLESNPRADKEYHIFLRRSAKVEEPGDFIRVRKRPFGRCCCKR